MDYDQPYKLAEFLVVRNVEHKFNRIARRAAEEERQKELSLEWDSLYQEKVLKKPKPKPKTWAKVADQDLYRATIYQARKLWASRVVGAGLMDIEAASKLAKLKYPL